MGTKAVQTFEKDLYVEMTRCLAPCFILATAYVNIGFDLINSVGAYLVFLPFQKRKYIFLMYVPLFIFTQVSGTHTNYSFKKHKRNFVWFSVCLVVDVFAQKEECIK